ncbi:phosphatidylglycerophosphatase A family protein [Aestuariispira ectoiniformans]|uniref:phosphatidylglycerophosphatase A family protein n=1 Tax=Aestuariispira ectoiniformans TaxID=2775080 RepID=UPI00223BFDC5|nr:phosphatidylglycerophosphatase A [Aestuariispira ectoiniformans]
MISGPISFWHPAKFLSTWFGVGLLRPAPGTWGTLAALPFAWGIAHYLMPSALFLAAILAYAIGIWSSQVYSNLTRSHDASEVVIDEVAGVWLTLAFAPVTVTGYAAAFLLFRLFDIAKPWPIGWADKKLPGGFGIMTDDMIAGLFAGIIIFLLDFNGWLPNVSF